MKFFLVALFSCALLAQNNSSRVIFVSTAPTGTCSGLQALRYVYTGVDIGKLYSCVSASWTIIASAGGASGTVSNVATGDGLTGGPITTTGTISATTSLIDGSIMYCADAGASDTYACSLSPVPAGYVTGAGYRFKANTANTGAATINFNSLGAKTIVKVAGGITTALDTNDIRAGQLVDLVYDGTNMQMLSLLGNAPAAGGGASITQGVFSSVPGTCTTNDLYLTTDSVYTARCSATNTWSYFLPTVGLVTPITSSGWSWVNQESATATFAHGAMELFTPAGAGSDLRIQTRTAPATPYTRTFRFNATHFPTDTAAVFFGFRESGTGKLVIFRVAYNNGIAASKNVGFWTKYTDATTFSGAYTMDFNALDNLPLPYWVGTQTIRIGDTGTNITLELSWDGGNTFILLDTVSRTDFMAGGPDEIVVGVNADSATYPVYATIYSMD